MRPVIVGEAPSMTSGRARAFDGRSGERLADLAGVELAELRAAFRMVNLLSWWPGPAGEKGSAFPAGPARERAARIRLAPTALLCGRRVADCFHVKTEYFEWSRVGGADVAVIPHPSGVSRWWNEPENVEAARAFVRGVWERL